MDGKPEALCSIRVLYTHSTASLFTLKSFLIRVAIYKVNVIKFFFVVVDRNVMALIKIKLENLF